MKKYLALLTLAAAGLQAAPITGSGDPLSNGALTGGIQVNFDLASAGLYSSYTLGSFTLTGIGADFNIGGDYNGNYNTSGGQSVFNGFDYVPTAFRFDFAGGASAFAFNWGAADYNWTLRTYNSGNVLLETINVAPTGASNANEYFGATGNISYATLTADSGDYVFIDRVTYKSGSTQSAPDAGSTVGLLGLALAGMAVIRRRLKA